MPIKVRSTSFVFSSEVLDNYSDLKEAFSQQSGTSFGDANHTMIDMASFRKQIDELDGEDYPADFAEHKTAVLARIDSLPQDIYIDLEN